MAGQAFLISSPHEFVDQCYMGPLCRTPSGHVYGIDDETFLNRWTDASAEPELNWRDPESDFPQLRDLVSAGETVLCSTRAGQAFRILSDGTAIHLTSGDRAITKWVTENDMVKLAISGNERFGAGGTKNGRIAIFDLSKTSGFEIARVQRHNVEVSAMAFNHDGTLLASGDTTGTFKIWRHREGELELLLGTDYLINPPIKMRFVPGKNILYVLCRDERGIRIFDLDRLNEVYHDMSIGW